MNSSSFSFRYSRTLFLPFTPMRFKYKRMWPQEYDRTYKPKLSSVQMDEYRNANFLIDSKFQKSIEFDMNLKRLFPELVPYNLDPRYRDNLRERLERHEMILRRNQINIPEFYPGSILQVIMADPNSPTKNHSFTGICIIRHNEGLWSRFTLRNVIDKTAVEYEYQLYNPKLQSIKVILLEKRLDDNLLYLRDAPLAESRVPLDMTPVPHSPGEPVPVNPKKVPILPRPWLVEWHLHGYRGIDEESMYRHVPEKELASLHKKLPLIDRYDLMKNYRSTSNLYDESVAFNQVSSELQTSQDKTSKTMHDSDEKRKQAS